MNKNYWNAVFVKCCYFAWNSVKILSIYTQPLKCLPKLKNVLTVQALVNNWALVIKYSKKTGKEHALNQANINTPIVARYDLNLQTILPTLRLSWKFVPKYTIIQMFILH